MFFVALKKILTSLNDNDYIHSFLKLGEQTTSKFGTRMKSNFMSQLRDYKHI